MTKNENKNCNSISSGSFKAKCNDNNNIIITINKQIKVLDEEAHFIAKDVHNRSIELHKRLEEEREIEEHLKAAQERTHEAQFSFEQGHTMLMTISEKKEKFNQERKDVKLEQNRSLDEAAHHDFYSSDLTEHNDRDLYNMKQTYQTITTEIHDSTTKLYYQLLSTKEKRIMIVRFLINSGAT